MFGFGTTEIILVVIVLTLFFGTKKVPELIKSTAKAVKNLRREFKDVAFEDTQKNNK